MIRAKTFNVIAQSAHIFSSIAIMYVGYYSFHWKLGVMLGSIIGLSAIKEAFLDPLFETKDEQGSPLVDFLFQAGGAILGLVLITAFS